MPLDGARAFRPVILANELLTTSELDALIAEFEAVIADPTAHATWFNLIQTWGRTPG